MSLKKLSKILEKYGEDADATVTEEDKVLKRENNDGVEQTTGLTHLKDLLDARLQPLTPQPISLLDRHGQVVHVPITETKSRSQKKKERERTRRKIRQGLQESFDDEGEGVGADPSLIRSVGRPATSKAEKDPRTPRRRSSKV